MARTQVPVAIVQPPKASLTTALTGTNNDLVFTAKYGGPAGNSIRVQYINAGASQTLSTSVQGFDVLVNLATDGSSVITSTAAQVAASVVAAASQLIGSVVNAGGNDGTGLVTTLALTNLTGGSVQTTPPAQTNGDATNGHYFTGNDGSIMLEVVSSDAGAQTVSISYGPFYAPIATVAAQVESVPAGATRLLGPFSPGAFNQTTTNDVYFTVSVSTNLKFRAYQVVRQA